MSDHLLLPLRNVETQSGRQGVGGHQLHLVQEVGQRTHDPGIAVVQHFTEDVLHDREFPAGYRVGSGVQDSRCAYPACAGAGDSSEFRHPLFQHGHRRLVHAAPDHRRTRTRLDTVDPVHGPGGIRFQIPDLPMQLPGLCCGDSGPMPTGVRFGAGGGIASVEFGCGPRLSMCGAVEAVSDSARCPTMGFADLRTGLSRHRFDETLCCFQHPRGGLAAARPSHRYRPR